MSAFVINGGRRISGSIRVQGSKNSVLPILAATVLINGVSVIHNCPDLSDTAGTVKILKNLVFLLESGICLVVYITLTHNDLLLIFVWSDHSQILLWSH